MAVLGEIIEKGGPNFVDAAHEKISIPCLDPPSASAAGGRPASSIADAGGFFYWQARKLSRAVNANCRYARSINDRTRNRFRLCAAAGAEFGAPASTRESLFAAFDA